MFQVPITEGMDSVHADSKDASDLPPYPGDAATLEHNADVPAGEEPPPYTGTEVQIPRRDDLLQPETLILSGHAITSGTAASSPRLYELSRSMSDVRESHATIQLSRLETRARNPPRRGVTTISKEIYTVARPPPITMPSFPYHLEPATRGGVSVALDPYGGFRSWGYGGTRRSGYRVFKTVGGRGPGELRAEGVLFSARGRGEGRYDWRAGGDRGRVLAYESHGQGFCQLQVVEGMERWVRDVLVGSWCMRLWQEAMDGEPRPVCKWNVFGGAWVICLLTGVSQLGAWGRRDEARRMCSD